jgi:hypothetical protein
MVYEIDWIRVSLPEYLETLKGENLLPGRRILLEDIDGRFLRMIGAGADTLSALKRRLSTPEKLALFSAQTGIPGEYLTILKRQMGSLLQSPVPLSEFPGLPPESLEKLRSAGLRSSKDYLMLCQERGEAPGKETGLDPDEARALACLCELVQINGVGPAAASALYDAGYRSVRDVARASADKLLKEISVGNAAGGYYRATLGGEGHAVRDRPRGDADPGERTD